MSYIHGGRELEHIPFNFGQVNSIDLPRDRVLRYVDLWFNGTLTGVTTSGTTTGAVRTQGVLDLIDKVEVVGNGVTTLFSIDGRSLYNQNAIDSGVLGLLTEPAAATTGAKPIAAFLRIPFENQIGANPADTRLNAASFQSLTLKITWASTADGTVYTSARSMTDSMPATDGITPYLYESIFPALPNFLRVQEFQDISITAANANFQERIRLSKTGKYQRMGLRALSDGQVNDAVIDSITLKTGANIDHIGNQDFGMLQYANQLRSGLTALQTGFGWLYLTESGLWTTGLTTSDTNSCELNLNLTSPGTVESIRVHTDFVQPLAKS